MKKIFSLMLIPVLLAGCSSNDSYVHTKESRSTVYYGQPVAELYENFGTPTRGIKYSAQERALIYNAQEIEKNWASRYLRYCTMTFYLKEDKVVNWTAAGDQCAINEATAASQPGFYPADSQPIPSDAFWSSGGSDLARPQPHANTMTGEYGLSDQPNTAFSTAHGTAVNGATGEINNSGRYVHQVPGSEFGSARTSAFPVSSAHQSVYSQVPADAFSNHMPVTKAPMSRQQTVIEEEFGILDRPIGATSTTATRHVPSSRGMPYPQVPSDAF